MNNLDPSQNKSDLWRSAMVRQGSTVRETIERIDCAGIKIALFVGEDDKFIGTVSDGDIRRGLLRGIELGDCVDPLIRYDPLVVTDAIDLEIVRQLMIANKLTQIPIVNAKGTLVGIYLWGNLEQPFERSNLFVIMAGGFGTRMLPHTQNTPKPMLLVHGKPMLEHIIERAKSEGFKNFLISTHYLGGQIEEYFGDGKFLDVSIDYLREESPLGTGGALGLIEHLPDAPVIVTNGDILSDVKYSEMLDFHISHDAGATMAVRFYEWQHPFGVVETNGLEIVGFEEKPIYRSNVNAGVYILNSACIKKLNRGEYWDMPSIFKKLKDEGDIVLAYPIHEFWRDVGNPTDLLSANKVEN